MSPGNWRVLPGIRHAHNVLNESEMVLKPDELEGQKQKRNVTV